MEYKSLQLASPLQELTCRNTVLPAELHSRVYPSKAGTRFYDLKGMQG